MLTATETDPMPEVKRASEESLALMDGTSVMEDVKEAEMEDTLSCKCGVLCGSDVSLVVKVGQELRLANKDFKSDENMFSMYICYSTNVGR